MRRPLLLAAVLVGTLVVAPTQTGESRPSPSWAKAEIRIVVGRGLMALDLASFRPDDTLTRGELEELVAGLTGEPALVPPDPSAPVTMAALDARLVRAVDLHDAAAGLTRSARAAGLAPPSRFGTEIVARLLGLRKNHPASQDALERLPGDPASRAEAAYSAAAILRFGDWEVESTREAAVTFTPPVLEDWQRRVLTTAFSLVGYPYVWAGESERPDGGIGPQPQGGFDCSGFVWRVFKLQAYAGGEALVGALRGRTTFSMSGEVPRSARIPFARLAPGDLVFFGSAGRRSKPAQIDHMGIYAGSGWMVHSSRYGVTLAPLTGWYHSRFAWGRRPLAEAGLVPAMPPTR